MWVSEKTGFGKIPWINEALETELMNTYCLTELIVNVSVKTAESCARKVIEVEKEADFRAYGRVMRAVSVKIRARPQTCVLDVAHFLRHLFLPKEHNKQWAEHRPYLLMDLMMAINHISSEMLVMFCLMIVRKLYQTGVFELDDVLSYVRKYRVMFPMTSSQMIMACLVFAREIDANAPELFWEFKKVIEMGTYKVRQPTIRDVLIRFSAMRENEYKLLSEYIEYGHEVNSLEAAIRSDNFDLFMAHASRSGFNMEQRVKTSCFEPFELLPIEPAIIEYAAFYGAHKIFKYLCSEDVLNARPIGRDRPHIAELVMMGGNMAIIQLLHRERYSFIRGHELAAAHFHHDLLSWLVMRDTDYRPGAHGTYLTTAAASGNIRALVCGILQKLDVNVQDKRKYTPLHHACESGQYEIVKLLLAYQYTRPSMKNSDAETALMLAAKYGFPHIVRLFKNVPNIDVNAQDKNGWRALHRAVERNHIQTLKALLSFNNIDVNCHDAIVCFAFTSTLPCTSLPIKVLLKLLRCYV